MQGYTPGFQPKAAGVVKLNTNESPYPPSPKAVEVLHRLDPERLRRYPDPAGQEFRIAAGEVNAVPAEWILCCNGGDDLLTMAFRAICDAARPVAYPVPTYSLYPILAKLQGCEAIEVPFDEGFGLPGKLAAAQAPLTIVCNPNAPSGTLVSQQELARLAGEIRGVLLIDEAYVDYAETNCVNLVRSFDNVIILRSMSKGYSLAGLRFGYAIAQPDMIQGLMKVKDSYNVDAVAIAVATAAIGDRAYFQANVEKVVAERTRLTAALRDLGFDVAGSQTNFVLARCGQGNAADLHDKLAQRHIYVRYFAYAGLEDKLRITVGTAEQNDRLLSALEELIGR